MLQIVALSFVSGWCCLASSLLKDGRELPECAIYTLLMLRKNIPISFLFMDQIMLVKYLILQGQLGNNKLYRNAESLLFRLITDTVIQAFKKIQMTYYCFAPGLSIWFVFLQIKVCKF